MVLRSLIISLMIISCSNSEEQLGNSKNEDKNSEEQVYVPSSDENLVRTPVLESCELTSVNSKQPGSLSSIASGVAYPGATKDETLFQECEDAQRFGFETVSENLLQRPFNYYFKEVKDSNEYVIFFHGNGSSACSYLNREYLEPTNSKNIVVVEYPGYAKTAGPTDERKVLESAILSFRSVLQRNPYAKIHLSGYSLGTSPASFAAAKCGGSSLTLAAPFTTFLDVAKAAISLPESILSMALQGHEFASQSWASEVKVPTLILHGKDDTTVRPELGQKMSTLIEGAEFYDFEKRNSLNSIKELFCYRPV